MSCLPPSNIAHDKVRCAYYDVNEEKIEIFEGMVMRDAPMRYAAERAAMPGDAAKATARAIR